MEDFHLSEWTYVPAHDDLPAMYVARASCKLPKPKSVAIAIRADDAGDPDDLVPLIEEQLIIAKATIQEMLEREVYRK